ncbi:hypothetical protein TTHERM_00529960 (macronuclear) [Tetrahymena thermophila SB210]|uniref:Uncharacterized protein n=1 Tax=Tetrahymena thermophila (strain SB210) TaxID=312017 RepID=I7M6E2_TETTS|nr:hypothetical protein TTHERM_00529960 [Tetrahymena thermophila SB210]EAR85044.1 hypothetical protein TTHERM_00529960 [Tetrahymena thermophila SB210]|eukprot:XP_001032707.1 hypothetical protein TTHERM_00529960 [Tetrahymena thermophila SB210]
MSEIQFSLSIKNIEFGNQNEYLHDLGCYLSQISDQEERFIDLILFSDECNKANLQFQSQNSYKLRLVFKRLSTNESVGYISFSDLQLLQIPKQTQQFQQWFTLFDSQNDDEFDGVLGESNDQENPRVLLQFILGETSNIMNDLRQSQQEQQSLVIDKIRETDEEHQENFHSLQLQKIKKQSSCEQNFQKRVESGLKRVEDAQKELLISEQMRSNEKCEQILQYKSIDNVSQNLLEKFNQKSNSLPESSENFQNEINDLNLSDEDSNQFSSISKLDDVQLTLTSKEYQDKILHLQIILINQEKELERIQQQYQKSITGYQKHFQDLNDENVKIKNKLIEQEFESNQKLKILENSNKCLNKQVSYMKTVLQRRDKILEIEPDQKKLILSVVDQINQLQIIFQSQENVQNSDINNSPSKIQNLNCLKEQLSRVSEFLEKQSAKEESLQHNLNKLEEELKQSNELLEQALKQGVESQQTIQQLNSKIEKLNQFQVEQLDEFRDMNEQLKNQQHLVQQEKITKLQLEAEVKEFKEKIKGTEQQYKEQIQILQKEIEQLKLKSQNKNVIACYKAKLEEKDQIHAQLLQEIQKLQSLMRSSLSEYESIQKNDIQQYTKELESQIEQLNNIITEKDKRINELIYQNQDQCIQIAQQIGQKEFIENLIKEIDLCKNNLAQLGNQKDKLENNMMQLQQELIKKNEQNINLVQKLAKMQNQLRQTVSAQEKIVSQASVMEQNSGLLFQEKEQFKENRNNQYENSEIDRILYQEYSQFKFIKVNKNIYQFGSKLLDIQLTNNSLICRVVDQQNNERTNQFILLDDFIKLERHPINIFDSIKTYNSSSNVNSCYHQRNSSSSSYSSKENPKHLSVFTSRDKEQLSSCSNTQRSLTNGIIIKKSPLQVSRISSHNSQRQTQNQI